MVSAAMPRQAQKLLPFALVNGGVEVALSGAEQKLYTLLRRLDHGGTGRVRMTDAEIARHFGHSLGHTRRYLKPLEDRGLIRRVREDGRRVILLSDPRRPVELPGPAPPSAQKMRAPARRKCALQRAENARPPDPPPIEDRAREVVVGRIGELPEEGPGPDPIRPTTTIPEARPAVAATPTAAPVPVDLPEEPRSIRDILARAKAAEAAEAEMAPAQTSPRAGARWGPDRDLTREEWEDKLRTMAEGGCKASARELAHLMKPVAQAEPPPPDAPTPALIAALADPCWVGQATIARVADAIVRDMGDPRGYRFYLRSAESIVVGQRPVESLREPYERVQAAMQAASARGRPITNPGKYLTKAIQNWDREACR